MKGVLSAEDQLRVLSKVWGADRDGYVFLPYIDGSANTQARRRRGYHEGRAYAWPAERGAILAHLKGHTNDDLYFTPALFNAKRRTEQNVEAERTLWADLDPVDPSTLGELRPTIAWESSPGRYQAVWLLDRPRVGASWASKENHRLTLHIGADPSGWDSTQLLRVPGRPNHKFDYGSVPVPGVLLWDNGPRHTWEDFDELPQVGTVAGEDTELLDDDLVGTIDRHALWSTVRLKVSHRIREYMGLRTAPVGADRSSVLWEINRELADAGCSLIEIIALVRPSVWNKYAGRNDELRRLKTEAAKAIAARPDTLEAVADEDAPPKPGITWLSELAGRSIPRPRWLVEGIWARGACGFISGAPKSYKSWNAIDLMLSITTGTPFLGQPEHHVRKPAPVLYLQEEDDLRIVMSRLATVLEAKSPTHHWQGQVALSQPSRAGARGQLTKLVWSPPEAAVPLAVHVQTGFIASDPGWQAWLEEMVQEGHFAMVMIDTLGTTAGDIDTDRAAELMLRMLKPLKVIAQKHDVAVCLVHHNRKSNGQNNRAGNEMLGSVALHAWVDCAIYARVNDDGSISLQREAKLAPEVNLKIKIPTMYEDHRTGDRRLWDPEVILPGMDTEPHAQAETTPKEKPARVRGSADVIKLKHMGPGPWTADRVKDTLDCAQGKLDQLVKNGQLVQLDDGRYKRGDL